MVTAVCDDWLIAEYSPVSLFSLRSTYATSKGGKTLLVPTPYALKMALLDACFRSYSAPTAEHVARRVFDWIKGQPVRVRPPAECIVQNTFIRLLQPARDSVEDENASTGPFARTIAYREFVFFQGDMAVALGLMHLNGSEITELTSLLAHINCFGKRGSFWQFIGTKRHGGTLPEGFSLTPEEISVYPLNVVSRYRVPEFLDDFGMKLCNEKKAFERVSTYHKGEVRLNEHRILQSFLLPYQRVTAGRHFTHYRRTTGAE